MQKDPAIMLGSMNYGGPLGIHEEVREAAGGFNSEFKEVGGRGINFRVVRIW